ncbi:hypothetical protein ACJMK2_038451 [Sinanodonta woodiana]|uniref:Mutator-like transposase domain-containing protein n=1 Tax=Sinanodonta woodiana TaxID=1069815 RepID=A0ABD3WC45_SINWO
MLANQEYVKRMNTAAGVENIVHVETDTLYNNRVQTGCEAVTQSFSPLIKQNKRRKRQLVLSLATANKLCPKRNCAYHSVAGRKNYSTKDSIASTDDELLVTNLQKVESNNILKVYSVNSDASTQIEKAVREYARIAKYKIKQYRCFVHRLQTLQKQIKNVELKRYIFTKTYTRSRVRQEITRLKKSYQIEAVFVCQSQKAISF